MHSRFHELIVAMEKSSAAYVRSSKARRNLPPDTRDIRIDGGNHSQFGYYGFQPGDWPATITRDEQQRLTLDAILSALRQ